MTRTDLQRLSDARDFARQAQGNAGGLSADVLAEATQPLHAALFDLVVIGEALNKVSAEVQAAAPEIPWRAVADLRNIIVHSYWQVDLELIAGIIEKEIDPLVEKLEKLIAVIERTEK